MQKKNETKEKILTTAFDYLNEVGWENFTFENLSKKKKIKLETIYFFFENKNFLLRDFSSFIDEQVILELQDENFKKGEVKDNIFEVLMIRFEKLQPYKKALQSIFELLRFQPKMLNTLAKQLFISLDLVLDLSLAKKGFLFDKFALNGLFIIYINVFKGWLADDSVEMNKTMAKLDLFLSRSEYIVNKIKF
tara:strand:+ start:117 stop:692 length:576 start_codon:yes stop_codon:yes gene_type:complete